MHRMQPLLVVTSSVMWTKKKWEGLHSFANVCWKVIFCSFIDFCRWCRKFQESSFHLILYPSNIGTFHITLKCSRLGFFQQNLNDIPWFLALLMVIHRILNQTSNAQCNSGKWSTPLICDNELGTLSKCTPAFKKSRVVLMVETKNKLSCWNNTRVSSIGGSRSLGLSSEMKLLELMNYLHVSGPCVLNKTLLATSFHIRHINDESSLAFSCSIE